MVNMSYYCLLPERVELTVNSKKETNVRVKMGQGSTWAKSQNRPRIKMGWYHLSPGSVKLTVNSEKETNGRAKIGQESKWAKDQGRLMSFTPRKSLTNSEQ